MKREEQTMGKKTIDYQVKVTGHRTHRITTVYIFTTFINTAHNNTL